MKYAITLLMVCLPSFAYALNQIELMPSGESALQESIKYSAPFKKEYFSELEIGDSLSESAVMLLGKDRPNYRVTFQLETSLSVNGEGPHLDLTEWEHCTTQWHSLNIIEDNRVLLPNFDEVNVDCFPEVSDDEINEAILAQGGEEWVRIFEGEGWPDGYSPVEISLSTVRIKIEKLISAQWRVVTVINIAIPMGC
jgi:hypothetical protein